MGTPLNTPEMFWSKVVVTASGCWEWTKARDKDGYGKTSVNYRRVRCHRHAYELARGPVPGGLCVLHSCDNPPCCNPDHLFLGTNQENTRDKIAKGRQVRGEATVTAKLTAFDVGRLREMRASGRSYPSLAREFGISYCHARRICLGESWREGA